jgi:hypothetical protein
MPERRGAGRRAVPHWRRRRRLLHTAALLVMVVPPPVVWFMTQSRGWLAAAFVIPPMAVFAVWVWWEIRHARRFPAIQLDVSQRATVIAILVLFTFEAETVRRALGYARAAAPRYLSAVTVQRSPAGQEPFGGPTARLLQAWEEFAIPVPLTLLYPSPWGARHGRSISDPILEYAESLRALNEVWFIVPVTVSPDWRNRVRRATSIFGFRGRLMLYRNARVISVPTEVPTSRKPGVPWMLTPAAWWFLLVTNRRNTWRSVVRVIGRIRDWY